MDEQVWGSVVISLNHSIPMAGEQFYVRRVVVCRLHCDASERGKKLAAWKRANPDLAGLVRTTFEAKIAVHDE